MIFRSIKGLTLSELLLATAILAFVLGSLLLVFINCIFLNESNRNMTVAMSHAQYVMEDIKNTGFGNIATLINNNNWDWDVAAINANGLNALPNEAIDASVVISSPSLLDISVAANWRDRGMRQRSVNLRTLIAEP